MQILPQTDILGMGIGSTIKGVKVGREYQGQLYSKEDPIIAGLVGAFLVIDVKRRSHTNIEDWYMVKKYDKENFTLDSLEGEEYMIIENRPFLPISILDDLTKD